MKIDILTIFPEMFENVLSTSMLKRAQEAEAVEVEVHDLRDWATDKHKKVDDRPYGGGPGMVMKVDVVASALQSLKSQAPNNKSQIILLTPQGKRYTQDRAWSLSEKEHIILVAGHYEGFDERVREYVDEEISIGDYVLTGGEIPALVVVDSVVRLLPGVLGDEESVKHESFVSGGLDYPEYTRPAEYEGKKVPEVLLSGNHEKIKKWRKKEAEKKTKERRPDLEE